MTFLKLSVLQHDVLKFDILKHNIILEFERSVRSMSFNNINSLFIIIYLF